MKFDKLLDEYIQKKKENDVHVKLFGKYSPSQLSSVCLRKSYFSVIVEEIEWPLEKLKIFEAGNIIHDFATQVLEKNERFSRIEKETRFLCVVPDEEDLITISGRADAIAINVKSNELKVFEFKSIYSLKYVYKEPNIDHVRQLQLYLGCLHAESGYIVYIEKQTLKSVTHEVRYNHKLFMSLLENIKRLHYCVKNKSAPRREFSATRDTYPCSYCNFKNECINEENESDAAELIK